MFDVKVFFFCNNSACRNLISLLTCLMILYFQLLFYYLIKPLFTKRLTL